MSYQRSILYDFLLPNLLPSMVGSPNGPCYCHNMIYIFCLKRPQRDKPLRTSSQRIQDQNLLLSSKNYQMKRPKYTPPKSTPRFGRCTSTEHLEPFRVQDWWPGLGSCSFRPKTISSQARSPSPNLAPTMLQSTMPCSLVC